LPVNKVVFLKLIAKIEPMVLISNL